MRFTCLISAVTMATSVLAGTSTKCICLTKKDTTELVDAYSRLIGYFTSEDAARYLTDDFHSYSESINTFLNPLDPSDDYTFNRTTFEYAQLSQAGTPLEIQGEPIADCNHVSFIWTSTFGYGRKARGVTQLTAVQDEGLWKMNRFDVEFNSLNWAYNVGQYYCLFGTAVGNSSVCGAPQQKMI